MAQEVDHLFIDDGGVNVAMRAEAASRAQTNNNWTMAALITSNGGAALALLNHAEAGPATIVALGLYMLGVTAALVAGRLSATLASSTESLFVTLIGSERASRHLHRVAHLGDGQLMTLAEAHCKKAAEDVAKAGSEFDKMPSPDRSLAAGVISFFFGCIAAGFALF